MNVDKILRTFGDCGVAYLLIGGMNFLLRHEPVLTYDIDFWIHDTAENRGRCDAALRTLDAAWGATEQEWRPVAVQRGGFRGRTCSASRAPAGRSTFFAR